MLRWPVLRALRVDISAGLVRRVLEAARTAPLVIMLAQATLGVQLARAARCPIGRPHPASAAALARAFTKCHYFTWLLVDVVLSWVNCIAVVMCTRSGRLVMTKMLMVMTTMIVILTIAVVVVVLLWF